MAKEVSSENSEVESMDNPEDVVMQSEEEMTNENY